MLLTIVIPRWPKRCFIEWKRKRKEPVSYTHLDVYKRQAKKNLVKVPILKGTVPHEQSARFGGAEVFIKPASLSLIHI